LRGKEKVKGEKNLFQTRGEKKRRKGTRAKTEPTVLEGQFKGKRTGTRSYTTQKKKKIEKEVDTRRTRKMIEGGLHLNLWRSPGGKHLLLL